MESSGYVESAFITKNSMELISSTLKLHVVSKVDVTKF